MKLESCTWNSIISPEVLSGIKQSKIMVVAIMFTLLLLYMYHQVATVLIPTTGQHI